MGPRPYALLISTCLFATACSGGGGTSGYVASVFPTPTSSSATASYAVNESQAATWIVSSAQRGDGAIMDSSTHISPYFANRAAIGLAVAGGHAGAVKSWMSWYLAHLNATDTWGTSGTIYDYTVNGGIETSTATADSTDSYAATFLSLALAYYQSGDSSAPAYLRSVRSQLDAVANVVISAQQADGLTWARPDYHIKYLMDNCEVYAGLRDYAIVLRDVFGDAAAESAVAERAQRVESGVNVAMWNASDGQYYNYVGEGGFRQSTDWTNYYSAAAELFPILYGVIASTDPRAQILYARFNASFAAWPALQKPDRYPWVLVSTAAAMMNDAPRASSFVSAVDTQYAQQGYPYPWYDAEAGWFVQTNALLTKKSNAMKTRRI